MKTQNLNAFDEMIENLEHDENILEMKKYRHHYETNCYEHCRHVAYYTYILCKKYNLDCTSAVRAAMLHDLFLYDWRVKSEKCPRLHGFRHPRIALKNASLLFDLNPKEKDIILKHMWPLTIKLPKYKESYIVSIADKIAVYQESKKHFQNLIKDKKIYRYAYVFLCLIIFKIF